MQVMLDKAVYILYSPSLLFNQLKMVSELHMAQGGYHLDRTVDDIDRAIENVPLL